MRVTPFATQNTGMPAVSVIVPFRDVRPYLARCIESLLDQTLSRNAYELLFIDNNSIDGGILIRLGQEDYGLQRSVGRSQHSGR